MNTSDILNRYIFRPDVGLLFDPQTGIQHSLNPTAQIIVKRLLNGQPELEVAHFLVEEYGIAVSKAKQDITDLLTQLNTPSELVHFLEFEKALDCIPTFPFALEVELTRLCNWNCVFCYNVWKLDEMTPRELNAIKRKHFDTERLFSILQECRQQGLLRVRYSGGEPTLHPDFQRILDYGASLGFYQVVFTNGHSLDNDTARLWSQSSVKEVLISLHGTEEIHNKLTAKRNAYQRAINAIHNALDTGLGVVVEMILTGKNVEGVLDTIETVKAMGVQEFRVMRYIPRGKGDNELNIPYNTISRLITILDDKYDQKDIHVRFPCSPRFCLSDPIIPMESIQTIEERSRYLVQHCNAGINWISLSYDGKLRICPHSNVYLADVNNENKSVKESWENLVKTSVVQVLESQKLSCDDCKAWSMCLGGCYLSHFHTNRLHY